jgi:hypothetical protein
MRAGVLGLIGTGCLTRVQTDLGRSWGTGGPDLAQATGSTTAAHHGGTRRHGTASSPAQREDGAGVHQKRRNHHQDVEHARANSTEAS